MIEFPVITSNEEFNLYFENSIWLEAAHQICRRHHIYFTELRLSPNGEHIVFFIDNSFIIKIYRPFRKCFEREKKALEFIGGKINFIIPEIVQIGEFENFKYIVITQLSGLSMTRAEWLVLPRNEQFSIISELAKGLKEIHSLAADSFKYDWNKFVEERAETFIEMQIERGVNSQIIKSLPAFIETNLKLVPVDLPGVFLHGDVHFGNLRLNKSNGRWQISGLFDFADSRRGFHEYDFLAVGILMIQGQTEIQREFFKSYGYGEDELDESFRKRLMMLTMLYETSDLRRYALRLRPEVVDFSLEELEKAIWSFTNKI